MIHLTSSLGDFRVLTIPLEKEGVAFSPNPSTGALIFTAKRSYQDADTAAIIQKSSTAGIILNDGIALVSLFREDTVALDPCKLFFEILWQDTGSLLAQPIAVGILDLSRRLTRSQQTSISVVSTATPLPFSAAPALSIIRSATPPSDTSVIWFDAESASELIWYVDAWVETSSASGSGGVPYIDPNNSVVVASATTDLLRGTALRAAYSSAKLLTPNGAALSATNRVAVIIPPGKYKLTATLNLDGEFVDLLPLVPGKPSRRQTTDQDPTPDESTVTLAAFRPGSTLIYSEVDYVSTVTQTADNVRLTGFSIAHLGVGVGFFSENKYIDADDWGALLIGQGCDNAASQYEDMYFWTQCATFSSCGGVRAYESFSGTWSGCVSNAASFRTGYGNKMSAVSVFSANMYDCDAGPFSFIGDYLVGSFSVATCRFERCKSLGYSMDGNDGYGSFAGCGITGISLPSTCVFVECTSGANSFGIGNHIAGTFIRCRAGETSFGSTNGGDGVQGTFAGYAEDCTAGANSFGGMLEGASGKCTGTLVRCSVSGNTKPIRLEGATIRDCRITVATTGIHALTILDSNCSVTNSEIIVVQGGTGLPIYAASALNVVAASNRMNNATNDADGLGSNVTNLVTTSGNVVSNSIR